MGITKTMDRIKPPLVSIIMPAYNTEAFIGEAIESIRQQSYQHIELLICDDGSTDKTHQIAQDYAAEDERIRVFKNPNNIGNLKTTNFLFSQCAGEYIVVQDSDDMSHVKRLEILVGELESDSRLGVVGANYVVFDNGKNEIFSGFLPITNEQIKQTMEKEVPPILWGACMFRRRLLEQVGGLRPAFRRFGFADLDLLYRMCELSECKNIRQILYYYRKSDPAKYPSKGILPEFGLEILVEAHRLRSKGQVDFIDKEDIMAIRRFVSNRLFRRAEQRQWAEDFSTARRLYMKAFLMYPLNINAIKNLLKIRF